MLKLNKINVSFGSHHVLKNTTCSAQPGDFIVIVGTNGAGKSTFFDTIAGRILPESGTITLDEVDVTQKNEQARASSITRIFQNTSLNSVGSLTVWQNLALAQYSRKSAQLRDGMTAMPRNKAEELMHQLGLPIFMLDKTMQSLSGGQRQLIAFGMATLHIPKILLLDEPTAALDPQASTKLLSHAVSFIKKNKVTTLLITHDPHIALSIGNKIWILDQGVITKEFNEADKKNLHPDQLIGHIDYEKLAAL